MTVNESSVADRSSVRFARAVSLLAASLAVLVILGLGTWVWAMPRERVGVPGPAASPDATVLAYLAAVRARDFESSNAIDARPGTGLSRFSRPTTVSDVRIDRVNESGSGVYVSFSGEFDGDGFGSGGQWGFFLERSGNSGWRIVDAGIA